jgi:hypothetical protein
MIYSVNSRRLPANGERVEISGQAKASIKVDLFVKATGNRQKALGNG